MKLANCARALEQIHGRGEEQKGDAILFWYCAVPLRTPGRMPHERKKKEFGRARKVQTDLAPPPARRRSCKDHPHPGTGRSCPTPLVPSRKWQGGTVQSPTAAGLPSQALPVFDASVWRTAVPLVGLSRHRGLREPCPQDPWYSKLSFSQYSHILTRSDSLPIFG
ncbi:hypothetical protein B0H67DRAFT_585528 [Lasiosphaeris hirsuta]|uniref:Uncharacterized protein n=1 Tax=Lasiosphaeris hirsuta TaxID=260670 RepID=A0AA40DTP5_9PEZI|nr:hypothetical protein B0H67DRAFT_585528 [Lasiosphaeris hirsuta]